MTRQISDLLETWVPIRPLQVFRTLWRILKNTEHPTIEGQTHKILFDSGFNRLLEQYGIDVPKVRVMLTKHLTNGDPGSARRFLSELVVAMARVDQRKARSEPYKVLLAYPSCSIKESLQTVLGDERWIKYFTVSTGASTPEAAKRADILLLGHDLEDQMSTLVVLSKLTTKRGALSLPVIMLGGQWSNGQMGFECARYGVCDYLVVPYGRALLLESIRSALTI